MANLSVIRDICKSKGITLSKLALDLDLTFSGLQSIIAKNTTKIDTLERIAEYLHIPVSQFFPDDPNSTIYFGEIDRQMIEKDIEANSLSEYKNEILSAFNFVDIDIKGKFVDQDKKTSSLTKEGIINEIFIRYIMKRGLNKETDHLRKIIEDKIQIIEFLNDKLKTMKDDQSKP